MKNCVLRIFPNYFMIKEISLWLGKLTCFNTTTLWLSCRMWSAKNCLNGLLKATNQRASKKPSTFAHIAIAELLKQGYFSRILTVNFDPLFKSTLVIWLECTFLAIYDLGAMGKVNAGAAAWPKYCVFKWPACRLCASATQPISSKRIKKSWLKSSALQAVLKLG